MKLSGRMVIALCLSAGFAAPSGGARLAEVLSGLSVQNASGAAAAESPRKVSFRLRATPGLGAYAYMARYCDASGCLPEIQAQVTVSPVPGAAVDASFSVNASLSVAVTFKGGVECTFAGRVPFIVDQYVPALSGDWTCSDGTTGIFGVSPNFGRCALRPSGGRPRPRCGIHPLSD